MTVRWWSAVIAGVLFTTLLVLTGRGAPLLHLRETSGSTYYCSGYSGCRSAGYSDSGYGAVSGKMYWRMYPGHNCVNYAAYRMIQAGLPNTRPWSGSGNAANWGHAMARITNQTPAVGAVAWWDAYHHVGSAGHVAYVEKVNSPTDIIISEDSWSGTFHWQHLTKSGGFWPSGFIHFRDKDAGPVLANKVKPFITGTAKVGSPLTGHVGTWTGKPSAYKYTWTANGTPIPGATGPGHSTYTPSAAVVGKKIALVVTGWHKNSTSVSATSTSTAAVVKGRFSNTALPTFSGDPIVGSTLTASPGGWSPTPGSYTYNWWADGKPIDGATGSALKLTDALVGKKVALVAHARGAGFKTMTRTSSSAQIAAGRVTITTPYTVSGVARPGATLRVQGGFTPSDAKATYQWLRGGRPIAGAHGATYRLQAADDGYKISVRVSVAKQDFIGADTTAVKDETVRSRARVELHSRGIRGGAVVHIHVTSPALDHVTGAVTVRLAGVRRRVQLVNGAARVEFSHIRAGHYTVRAYYLRNRWTFEAHRSGGVTVRSS